MLRGLMIWMALCLGLAMLWQLAQLAAQRAQLVEEHYAAEGALLPSDAMRERTPPHEPPCGAWSQECWQFRCEETMSPAALHARLQ